GVWALAMLDDFDGALAVIATWRHRYPSLPPAHEQALLAAEARVESIRHHHARELHLLEEALAICDDAGLGFERMYLEASYAIALVRAGELPAANQIVRDWNGDGRHRARAATARNAQARNEPARNAQARNEPARNEQALEVYRDVARTELALLAGDARSADAAARRVLAYANASGNLVYGCLARFHRVLAATRARRPALLAEYGRAAAQLQIPVHLRRHRLLDELPREARLVVRERRRKHSAPLVRLFYPALTDLGSELCWDRVQGTLYMSGDGPFSLAEHPVIRRVLEVILARSAFELPIATLFEHVWEMSYEPLRHEGKCHVALHRLRALLGGWRTGADRLIEVRDGTVRIADDANICVIELPRAAKPVRATDSLTDRVATYLEAAGEASPAELAKRIGVSRNALLLVLRGLVAEGRVERIGRARAIRYRAC
ncbi:MAG TPA: hypothetical protein VFV99_31730, partial [Kofleriaceae bacterium]|nr:hypothetical protein [Kofleriaceae bacterium]